MLSRSDWSKPRMSDVMPTIDGDADDDAEHRQRRAQLVAAQRVERHARRLRRASPLFTSAAPRSDPARAARDAGYSPKNSPTAAVMPMPSTTDHGSSRAGSGVTAAMASAARNPSAMPTMPPKIDSVTDSVSTCDMMSRAPRAERLAQADLARALADDHQHDVHDDDAADDAATAPTTPTSTAKMPLVACL